MDGARWQIALLQPMKFLFDASVRNPIESKSRTLIANLGQKEGMANLGDQRDEVLRVDKALFREELQRLMDLHDHLDAFLSLN